MKLPVMGKFGNNLGGFLDENYNYWCRKYGKRNYEGIKPYTEFYPQCDESC